MAGGPARPRSARSPRTDRRGPLPRHADRAGTLGDDGLCARLPFAGGALDPEQFATCAHVAAGDPAPALTTLVIVRESILSDLERRALDRLPSEGRLALAARA